MSQQGKYEWDRVAEVLTFPDITGARETYGFASTTGNVNLEGQRFVPRNKPSKTAYLFMHPSSTLQLLPMPGALAAAGLHVICGGTRYPKNDSALIMEKCVMDMGAWVRAAKEKWGYENVILVGWSGGGSLSLFYQAEAEHPTITHTPAGDPFDLSKANLIPANGVIFIAAHLSRAETLTEWTDPSVIDESNPDKRDLELDIYNPDCPNKPPFSKDFVAKFRAAQIARNRRITANVEEWLETLKKRGGPEQERAFVVQRTMCDVRWIDATVDPNGRKPNWTYMGDPRAANVMAAGLARYTSLRSWLSQWSYDKSNGKGSVNATRIKNTPVIQIENMADDAVPATHNPTIHHALATKDKEWKQIEGATHYYVGQPEHLKTCIDTVKDWSTRKKLLND